MDFRELAEFLEPFAQIATGLGVLVAVAAYFLEIRRGRRDQSLQRFNDLNQQYREWLLLFVQKPQLHRSIPYAPQAANWTTEAKAKAVAFELKLCELESAYFHYRRQKGELDRAQWQGWESYIRDWMSYEEFRLAWEQELADEFDQEFRNYVEREIKADLAS